MELVVLSIHLLVSLCLVGLVLLQRSEGGALGMGGGGGGALMSGRGAADALARMTSVAGGFFLVTSLGLTMLAGAANSNERGSVMDAPPAQTAPATIPTPTPALPPAETVDPTESSAPQAAETQLASIAPAPAAAATPEPAANTAATRAGPIESRPSAPATAQRQPVLAATRPATTQPAATQRTAPATPPPAPTQRAASPPSAPVAAVNGVTLTEAPSLESVEAESGLEAVRRERAGPDQ
jgi:preprotein translocase subunit SecG